MIMLKMGSALIENEMLLLTFEICQAGASV